ncbi:unnamed protein product [Brassica napus]|uniref:(rape) hypothetical protein n=1 Tax=Brassica napus TaxID=3708 RepID=A0A816R8L9_BRANA|nr:unnamed protein product [Brassica napus]
MVHPSPAVFLCPAHAASDLTTVALLSIGCACGGVAFGRPGGMF